jgi:hypothetical protein
MSFILDALKKLEREKESARPGVVMVGPVAWGGRDRSRLGRRLAAGAGAVLVAVVALAGWWLGSREAPPPGPPEELAPAPPASPAGAVPPARGVPSRAPRAPETTTPAPATDDAAPGASRGTLEPPESALPPPAVDSPPVPELVEPPASGGGPGRDAPGFVPLEDPPVVAEDEPPVPELRLTAISERDGEPIALLNDRLVREGDRVGDLVIIRIGNTDIEIEVNGERRVVGF